MSTRENRPKRTSKQNVALAGVIVLVLIYLASLVVAIVDKSASGTWLKISLFATVAVPMLTWAYIWMYGKLTGKRTIADAQEKEEE
jgi:hypothetical protein